MNSWIQNKSHAGDWTWLIRADEVTRIFTTRGRVTDPAAYDLPEGLNYVRVQDHNGNEHNITEGVPVQRAVQMARELTA